MRRLLKLLLLVLLALLLLGPAARAQDFRVTASSPAPGDSSVALQGTVTFTFIAPLDTTHHFEGTDADWPVAFAAISPRDSLQIDSVRYSADLTQIHFDVTHADSTDFVWVLTGAYDQDSTQLVRPRALQYTTAARPGSRVVTGALELCIATKHGLPDTTKMVIALLEDPRWWSSSPRVAAASPVVATDACMGGDFVLEGVRPGTYWLAVSGGWMTWGWDTSVWACREKWDCTESLTIGMSDGFVIELAYVGPVSAEQTTTHETTLHPNRPNPFRTSTRLPFTLEHPARVRLAVYDLLGRRVATLADGFYPAGEHAAAWQAEDAPPGVYLVRLEGDGFALARPIVRVR